MKEKIIKKLMKTIRPTRFIGPMGRIKRIHWNFKTFKLVVKKILVFLLILNLAFSWSYGFLPSFFDKYSPKIKTAEASLSGEKVIFLTSSPGSNQTWTVPADWSNNNKIEVIGAGGGGRVGGTSGAGGGGGGAYSVVANVSGLSGSITYRIGAGGGAGTAGGDTFFNRTAGTANTCADTVSVCAKGGSGSTSATGAAGGAVASNKPANVGFAGGAGGTGSSTGDSGGGGGGAAGPNGAGLVGGAGQALSPSFGGGGGGANGGAAGTAGSHTSTGGRGGMNYRGTGGGLAANATTSTAAVAGTSGGGGGAGAATTTTTSLRAGAAGGGNGGVWTSTHAEDGTTPSVVSAGPGGGGGGGGAATGDGTGSVGGAGGAYGGGGGGAYTTAGIGGQGLIVITYIPNTVTNIKTIFLTSSPGSNQTWTVPNDWSDNNEIYVLGAGGGGRAGSTAGARGGGGGAISTSTVTGLSPGGSVTYRVGSGGTGGTTEGTSGANGGDTFFNRTAGTANTCADTVSVCAKGGTGGTSATAGGVGGAIASNKPAYAGYSGGAAGSGNNTGDTGGGGGGAAGPYGAGRIGGAGQGAAPGAGGGGGGAGGAGASAGSTTGGAGGVNFSGTGGGTGANPTTNTAATAGTSGGGGGGGAGTTTTTSLRAGANGSNSAIWTQTSDSATIGPGGGGGGGGATTGVGTGSSGGSGGYGGGGGGAYQSAGSGGQGFIVIRYVPNVVPSLTTDSASSITSTTAILNGNITATGGRTPTVRGFAWGTSSTMAGDTATTTENGSFSTGAFTKSDLTFVCGTTYYFRAYATSVVGTGFGSIQQFTTSSCGIDFSGTAYISEGGAVATSKSIKVYKNGTTLLGSATSDVSTGAWSATLSPVPSSGDILTVYIDGDVIDANTILITDGTAQSNVNLYGNTLIVRKDTAGGSITNANLFTGAIYGEDDMIYATSSTANITLDSNANLHVYTGDTYSAEGTLTTQGTGDLRVATTSIAFLNTTGNTIAGDLVAYDGSLVYINANTTVNGGDIKTQGTSNTGNFLYSKGAYTPTVTISGTGVIQDGNASSTFYALTITGTGTITGATSLASDNALTIQTGGSLIRSNGTFTMANGSTISNSGTLTFYGLIVESGGTITANTDFSIANALTIGSTATLNPSSGTITMLNGSTITNSGTLLSFNNLTIPASATITANTDYTVKGTLSLGSSANLSASSGTVSMANGSTITNSGTLSFFNLTLPDSATVSTASSFSISGALSVGAGANLSPSAGTITMTGGSITNSGTLAFNNLTIAGNVTTASTFSVVGDMTSTSGTFTTSGGTITITGDLSLAGTITGTGSITTNGGDTTGSGTLNLTSGTFTLDGTGLFGSNTNWTFNELKFGDGSGVATTTSTGTGTITTATTTISANQILDAGVSKTWNLTASHEPFQLSGTLLASTSSFVYQGTNNATVTPATYYNLEIAPSSGNPTYLVVEGAIGSNDWYSTGGTWTYRKAITIDHTKVSGSANHTNFPVLIDITDSDLASNAKSNGYDILFTTSDGLTKLDYEREIYTTAIGRLTAWVEVPTLDFDDNTIIYMYYGNADATDQQNVSGTWDTNYKGVWHLSDGTTLGAVDSIGNGNGTLQGTPTAGLGKIDGAMLMDANTDYINAGSSNEFNFTSESFTVGAWIKPPSSGQAAWQTLIARGTYTVNGWYIQNDDSVNRNGVVFVTNQSAGTHQLTRANGKLSLDVWNYVVITRNGTSVRIYVDGTDQTTSAGSHSNPTSVSTNLIIGKWLNGMDEVRISNTIRSADWIATEYNNQSATSTFYTIGSQSTKPVASTLSVSNNLTIGGTGNATLDLNTKDPDLSISGNLTIGSGDTFSASDSGTLTISGNFSNNGTFTHNSGTITFSPTEVSTVSSLADITFNNLAFTSVGKTLKFQSHSGNVPKFTIAGAFNVNGQVGNPVLLESTTPGTQWLVYFNSAQTLNNISLKDAGCFSGSATVNSSEKITDRGGNGNCWGIIRKGLLLGGVEFTSSLGTLTTGGVASSTDESIDDGGGGTPVGGGGAGGGGGVVEGVSVINPKYLIEILEELKQTLIELKTELNQKT